jgi:hypothetical protein
LSTQTAFPTAATDTATLTGFTPISGLVGTARVWAGDANIEASDSVYATCNCTNTNNTSNVLQGSNYGFSTSGTITGLLCAMVEKQSNVSRVQGEVFQFMKGGAATGSQLTNSTWSTTNETINYGSNSNLSGGTYAPSDVNASGFGGAYQIQSTGGNLTPSIDSMPITVTYSGVSPPGTPTGLVAAFVSNTSTQVAFTQGSGTVTDNKYETSTDGVNWGAPVDIGSAVTSFIVTGLTPNTLYFFRVAASNSGGDSAYSSAVLWITGCNFGQQVSASNQDAFENTLGTVTITDNTDTLVALDYLGFLITSVNIPQGSDIAAAFLVLNLAAVTGISGSVTIDLQTGTASVFAATSANISSRSVTGESVTWPIGSLAAGWNQSPNFASAADFVINAGTWTSGNSIAAIVKGLVGAAGFDCQMWDGNNALAAYLFMYFATPATDQEGAFGGQMDMMNASNALVQLESQPTAFVGY